MKIDTLNSELFIEDLGRATGGDAEVTSMALGEEGGSTPEPIFYTAALGEGGGYDGVPFFLSGVDFLPKEFFNRVQTPKPMVPSFPFGQDVLL